MTGRLWSSANGSTPQVGKLLAAEMKEGNYSRVEADAIAQVEAGAHMLDVNAGIPLADEPAILAASIKLVQSVTDVPLSIDSSIVDALAAGLEAYQGKPLVNSVTGEEDRLETVLRWLPNTVLPSWRSAMTRPEFLRIRTSVSRSPRRLSTVQPTTASHARTSWSTRWSCRSVPFQPPVNKCFA